MTEDSIIRQQLWSLIKWKYKYMGNLDTCKNLRKQNNIYIIQKVILYSNSLYNGSTSRYERMFFLFTECQEKRKQESSKTSLIPYLLLDYDKSELQHAEAAVQRCS